MKCIRRDETIDILFKYFNEIYFDNSQKRVCNIYGSVNVGKTFLINEFENRITSKYPNLNVVKISLNSNTEKMEDIIICIRSQMQYQCPLFDYIYYSYLDMVFPTRTNKLHSPISTTDIAEMILKISLDLIESNVTLIGLLKLIPYGKLLENIKDLTKKKILSNRCKRILKFDNKTFINTSPEILKELFCPLFIEDLKNKHNNQPFLLTIDNTDSISTNHLLYNFINDLPFGLIIVASRECISQKKLYNRKIILIDELEENSVKNYLTEILLPEHFDLLHDLPAGIYMPIALERCVNIYGSIQNLSLNNVKAIFEEEIKKAIDTSFIDHLNDNIQDIIKTIVVVGLFDETLFRSTFPINKYHYFNQICNCTFIEIIKRTNEYVLYGIKDNMQDLSSEVYTDIQKMYILNYFLENYIKSSAIINEAPMAEVIFHNFINKYNKLDNELMIESSTKENLMHLFFYTYGYTNNETLREIALSITNNNMNDIKKAILIIVDSFNNTTNILYKYNKNEFLELGEYRFAPYLAISNYLCFSGQYAEGIQGFKKIYSNIPPQFTQNWVYEKAIINNADALMMQGKFSSALDIYNQFEWFSDVSSWRLKNAYDKRRQKAHIYRFNLDLENAEKQYSTLIKDYHFSENLVTCAKVNLLETMCFYNPQYVIDNYKECVQVCERLSLGRSIGKIYYSVGIAYIVTGNYIEAEKSIKKSISSNYKVGYLAGNIFATLAHCYLDYSKYNRIKENTYNDITNLIDKLHVYDFLYLPISIMQKDQYLLDLCKTQYEWLNFDETVKTYKDFLETLI